MFAAVRSPLLIGAVLRAWLTLEPKHWSIAASELGRIVHVFPDSPALLRVHAKILRAARRLDEAIAINEKTLALRPDDERVLLELGRAQRHAGQREQAIDTFAVAAGGGSKKAARELCRYGARARLPHREGGLFARADYGAFVGLNPVVAPPSVVPTVCFRVSLSGSERADRCSLESLRVQSHPFWFLVGGGGPALDAPPKIFDLVLPPGAILDRHCLAWLDWAVAETDCMTVRADHDYLNADGSERCDPVLLPQPDLLWTERPNGIARLAATGRGAPGLAAHVPLVLMTLPAGTNVCSDTNVPDGAPLRISVIIPTRDNPELLGAAVETLLAQAARPDLVEVVIIDNGSRTPAARLMFARLSEREGTRVLPFAEAFNWSRISNFGAAAVSGDVLLFLNDDTAMLTSGWDRILAGLLDNPAVGLVGARMIYPDGSIQHGGFVFGMDNGPQHEGRWMAGDDRGPSGRWNAVRQAVAVTGAFMAIRKGDFVRLNGFDEGNFAIDFADVDLCMRVRTQGLAVVYCGPISLLHHESVSRGLNLSRKKRRRMKREAANLRRRWGAAVEFDPGYHPIWARMGCSYDGLQAVTCEQAIQHISSSTQPHPWKT